MYQEWIGRTVAVEDEIRSFPIDALAATLDRPILNGEIPPLWHWTHFLVPVPKSQLSVDGHPIRGEFMPPISLPRRMWAAGTVAFHVPLQLGHRGVRTSTIKSIITKEGTTGTLVFVKITHQVESGGELLIEEDQDIVYRSQESGIASGAPVPAPESSNWVRDFIADEVMLFRYSALTFNSHRIHFDHDYARDKEGYSGLVVHGPLLATLLADLASEAAAEFRVLNFSYRARAPVFAGEHVRLCGRPAKESNKIELWAERHGGIVMSASAVVGEAPWR